MTKAERSRIFERDLPVILTQDEHLHRARELAGCYEQVRAIKAALSEETKRAKAQIAEVDVRAADLVAQLRSGKEQRPVECEEILDFARGCAEVQRIDTGEIVDSRPLRPEEMQTKLIPIDGGIESYAVTAIGANLDAIGERRGVARGGAEPDADYRGRIMSTPPARPAKPKGAR